MPEKREELALEGIPRAIKGAGFVPAEMQLQARGSFTAAEDGVSFRVRGWSRSLKMKVGTQFVDDVVDLRAAVDYSGRELVLSQLRSP